MSKITLKTLCKANHGNVDMLAIPLSKEERKTYIESMNNVLDSNSITCCICGKKIAITKDYWGNRPDPVNSREAFINYKRCCDACNANTVLPARMRFGRKYSAFSA